MKQLLKYEQLAAEISRGIENGIYGVGERLPSENEMTVQFGISRQTVRQALAMLERDGKIARRQGSGTTVLQNTPLAARSCNIAVTTTYIGEYIFPDVLSGIQETLAQRGYSPTIFSTQNRVDIERKILLDILDRPLDGLIIEGTKAACPNPNLDLYQKWADLGRPIVFVHSYYPELTSPVYVVTQDRQGGKMATEFLIGKGHRQIAGVFKIDDIQGHRRCAGYFDALTAWGLPVSDDHILWYSTENKKKLDPQQLMNALEDCTAVVCYNDEVAIQVLDIFKAQGLCVPEDVAVISFDNSSYSNLASVKITSCSQDKKQIGAMAAAKILGLLDGVPQQSVATGWSIVEREST